MVVRNHEIETQAQLWEEGAYPIGTHVEYSGMTISKTDEHGRRHEVRTYHKGILTDYEYLMNMTHLEIRRADENDMPYGPPVIFNASTLRRLIDSVEPLPGAEIVPAGERYYFAR